MIAPNQRNNSFDLVRFLAAVSVLISHHFALSGLKEPSVPVFRDTLGGAAVAVFFILSGYLIYQSLLRSNRWDNFFSARFLRIMPNLTVALASTSAVMLLWFSNYSNLESHIDYVIRNVGMFFHGPSFRIPGVLIGQPTQSINGSVWTLPYEFWLYVALFCIFLLPLHLRLPALLIGALVANGLYLFAPEKHRILFLRSYYIGKLGLYFLSGALVAALWPWISSRRWTAVICSLSGIAISRSVLPDQSLLYTMSLATIVILISTANSFASFGRYGDASYGIYIFAFPIQQLAIASVEDFWASMMIAIIITVTVGYMTWHTFEAKCLRYRPQLASVLSKVAASTIGRFKRRKQSRVLK